MRGKSVTRLRAIRRRLTRPDERGLTLVEILLAVTLVGIILIPVMAWSITAMRKAEDTGVVDSTVALARLNRFLKSDVAGSRDGNDGPYWASAQQCAPTSGPAPAADVVLSLLSSVDSTLVTYVKAATGETDTATGAAMYELYRRQCTWNTATATAGPMGDEDVVAEDLFVVGSSIPVSVSCAPRDEWTAYPDKDVCGEVAMTTNGRAGESTIRATRRVDPPLDVDPARKGVAVIKCTPTCPATGIRQFTVAFDSSGSYDPAGVAGVEWDFGDGTAHSFDPNPVHVYKDLGTDNVRTFKVKLTIFSNDGVGKASARTTVTVSNAVPVAAATPAAVVTNRVDYVKFDGTGSTDPDGDPPPGLTYAWDFGDGTSSSEAKPTGGHRYTQLGTFNASLTVKDANRVTDSVSIPVTVENKPPLACFESNQTSPVAPSPNAGACANSPIPASNSIKSDTYPMTVTFTSQSRDEDAVLGNGNIGTANIAPTSQIWYQTDAPPVGTGVRTQIGVGTAITRTFTSGLHIISLEAVDQDGARSTYSVLIEVNKRPTAVITPATGCTFNAAPYTCTLDGSGSTDSDGSVVSYTWDYGDGTTETFAAPTSSATHTWPTFGTYTARLTVKDDVGSVSSTSVRVKVNKAPTPVIGPATITALRKKAIQFDGSASTDDPTGRIDQYAWNFGDGTPIVNGVSPEHTYTTLGTKRIRLTVTDDDGLSSFVERTIVVKNQLPVAVIGGIQNGIIQGLDASFNGSASTDPDGVGPNPLTYLWEFGDGTTSTDYNATHTYTSYGTKLVRLTVTDADGESNTATLTVRINRLPVASFSTGRAMDPGYFQVNPGITLTMNGAASSDADGSIVKYSWEFGPTVAPGVFDTAPTVTQQYLSNYIDGTPLRGRFNVTLTVTDDLGGTASVTHEVLVIDKAPIPVINASPVPIAQTPTPTYAAVTNSPPNTFTFTSTGSNDPDGTIAGYLWDFGDGTTSTAANPPAKTYPTGVYKTYTVKLTVRDNDGVSSSTTVGAKVNQPPTAAVVGGSTIQVQRAVPRQFDGSGSTDADGTVVSYLWTWGDGTANLTTTNSKPNHTYANLGLYTLTLTVTDNDGRSSTVLSKTIDTRNAPPIPSFTMSATDPNVSTTSRLTLSQGPGVVTFDGSGSTDPDDASPTAIALYTWDFGDGSPIVSGTSPVVTHAYSAYGTYNPRLTVTDQGGATGQTPLPPATAARTVKVNRPPVVSFTPSTPQIGVDSPFNFTFDGSASTDSDGTISSYLWNLGNGQTRNVAVLTYQYIENGNYGPFTVSLTVRDNDGGVTTVSVPNLIQLNRPPKPVISSPSSNSQKLLNAEPFTWAFQSGSTDDDGTIDTYLWDFGDGTTSAVANPTKTYATFGTYTVKLTVTDNRGSSRSTSITVIANGPPTALIGPATLDPKVGLPFTFDGSGSSDVDGTIPANNYTWFFPGAATVLNPTTANPIVTWATTGSRTVTLKVVDANGRTSATVSRTLNVTNNVAPTASFTTNPSPPKGNANPFTVAVDGSGSNDPDGSIVSYQWNFGDGGTATGATASHDYTTYGNFTITLTVRDNSGVTATATVAVRNNRSPIAAVTTLPNPATTNAPPFPVFFDATASNDPDGTIVSYTWDFDDGSPTATGVSVTHTFTTRKIFQVKLTVVDNEGASTTKIVPVKVNQAPVAVAVVTPEPPQRLLPVHFDGAGSYDPDGTVVQWAWNFGDGSTGSGVAVDHTYVGRQAYTATLTVTDENGATNTKTFTVTTTNQSPVAQIVTVPSPAIGDPGFSVTLDGGGSYDPDGTLASYSWNFGDGATATGLSVTHAFSTTLPVQYKTYQVTLTVTDNDGGVAVTTTPVIVNTPPTVTIGAVSPIRGVPVSFAGSASDPEGPIAAWSWDFDDGPGSTSTQQNPTYTYKTIGTKQVRLTATDSYGKTTTQTRSIQVANRTPLASVAATANTPTPTQLRGAAPLTINFDGSGSIDPDNTLDANPAVEIATYAWAFGDGQTGTGATPSHVYAAGGPYTATLTVTDSDGGQHQASVTVTITGNVAPSPSFTRNPPSGSSPLTVFFDAAGSSDPDGSITAYSWNFGDGQTATGVAPSHTFGPGQFTVTLTVTDNSGSTASTTNTVSVAGNPPVPTGFRLTSEGGGNLNFTWDAVPGATGYQIVVQDQGGINIFCGPDSPTQTVGAVTTASLSACTTGRNYRARIQAINNGSYSGFTAWISVST